MFSGNIILFRRVQLVRPLEHKSETELRTEITRLLEDPTPEAYSELLSINWELRFREILKPLGAPHVHV